MAHAEVVVRAPHGDVRGWGSDGMLGAATVRLGVLGSNAEITRNEERKQIV